MAKRKRGKTSQEKYQEGVRKRKELDAREAMLKTVKCTTVYRTHTHLMIPKEGLAIHKRSIWKDGKYIGIVERFICDESMLKKIDIPQGQMSYQLPVSEYEILYVPREELEKMRP